MSRSDVSLTTAIPSARVDLLDHSGRVLATGSGSLQASVDPGLYSAQVSVGSSTNKEVLVVKGDAPVSKSIDIDVAAVTPVRSTTTNHEYHSYPARKLSENPRAQLGHGSRMVVFVHVPSADHEQAQQTIGEPAIQLLDRDLRPIGPVAWELGPGVLGDLCRPRTQPSNVLRSPGMRASIDQTIVASPGWTTLAFVPVWPMADTELTARNAALDAMTVHMIRLGMPFDPYEEGSATILAAEAALKGLRAGEVHLSPSTLDSQLAAGQVQQPDGRHLRGSRTAE